MVTIAGTCDFADHLNKSTSAHIQWLRKINWITSPCKPSSRILHTRSSHDNSSTPQCILDSHKVQSLTFDKASDPWQQLHFVSSTYMCLSHLTQLSVHSFCASQSQCVVHLGHYCAALLQVWIQPLNLWSWILRSHDDASSLHLLYLFIKDSQWDSENVFLANSVNYHRNCLKRHRFPSDAADS